MRPVNFLWQCGKFLRPSISLSHFETAPSRREPYPKLNVGDRKAYIPEGGGKPIGLTEGVRALLLAQ